MRFVRNALPGAIERFTKLAAPSTLSSMSQALKIGIVLGSTRVGRFSERPADWLLGIAEKRADLRCERVDLRDYPLPFFDEPKSPLREPSQHPVALKWARKVAELDALIFVSGEYNRSIPGVLKNALDYLYSEFNRKAAAFVGYGNAGGARGIEQLRLMLIELQMAPSRFAVHIGRDEYMAMQLHGKDFVDFPQLEQAAHAMLDDLTWWTRTLAEARAK